MMKNIILIGIVLIVFFTFGCIDTYSDIPTAVNASIGLNHSYNITKIFAVDKGVMQASGYIDGTHVNIIINREDTTDNSGRFYVEYILFDNGSAWGNTLNTYPTMWPVYYPNGSMNYSAISTNLMNGN